MPSLIGVETLTPKRLGYLVCAISQVCFHMNCFSSFCLAYVGDNSDIQVCTNVLANDGSDCIIGGYSCYLQ